MARYLQSLLLLYCLFFVTVTSADRSVTFNHGFLYGRADGDTDPSSPGLQCTQLCEVSAGSSPGPRSWNRRSISPCGLNRTPARSVFRPRFPDSKENVTERSLTRRAFPKEITNNQEAAEYVIEKVTGSDPPDGFFAEGTPAAVGYLRKFEDEAFSFGTAGLHGCTMIAIVSNRAVYIAHFWETYSTRGEDDITGGQRQQFLERVVNAIRGVPVPRPFNPNEASDKRDRIRRNNLYVPPVGDSIDFSLFNDESKKPMLYIMTPFEDGAKEDSVKFMYKQKYEVLLPQELQRRGRIRGLEVEMSGYRRLKYEINDEGQPVKKKSYEADWEEFMNPKHAKGMALFEYDGKDTWRLFFENKPYEAKVSR